MEVGTCGITKRQFPAEDLIPLSMIRPQLADLIMRRYPELTEDSLISTEELNRFRGEYVRQVLEADMGEISALENEVVRSLREHDILAEDIERQFETKLTFGERLADKIAEFGGSWTFILLFGAFLAVWICVNVLLFRGGQAPDPYPFILLNLLLSCLAALQAPVIMMSQNRLEAKDRLRGEHDYKVNLKAELEIRHLHEKVDFLLKQQAQRLFEIQQIQIDLMEELASKTKAKPSSPPSSNPS